MPFIKGTPGCPCCCTNYYNGSAVIRMVKLGTIIPPDTRYATAPDPNAACTAWTIDHYHQLAFVSAWWESGKTKKIAKFAMKIPDQRADITVTEVVDVGSSYTPERMCTASADQKLYYVVSDDPASTTYSFYEIGFDGTGNTLAFTRTMDASSPNLLTRIEHCRFDDKLYYCCRKSGDSYFKLYRCDRDGSNDALVFDAGASSPSIASTRTTYCFDNVRGKLYVAQRKTSTPFRGEILRMDLDGTNQVEIYDTGDYVAPLSQYGVYGIRFSHSQDSLYWIEGSVVTDVIDNTSDPTSGMYKAAYDGTSPTLLHGRYELFLSGTTTGSLTEFDIGCGLEKLGTGTEA